MPAGFDAAQCLLGAFGYISLAFLYLVVRSNAMAKNLEWSDKASKIGFWLLTIGVCIYALPTMVIGFHQGGTYIIDNLKLSPTAEQ